MLMIVLEQSLLFFPLALGVYFSYAILKTTDLTVDGSFVLGAAVFAKLITSNIHPLLSFVIATLAGSLAGFGVSLIQIKGRIHSLIASILAVFILTSLNLMIMQRPNISLLKAPTLTNSLPEGYGFFVMSLLVAALTLLLVLLLKTKTGLILRALGENVLLLRLMSIKANTYKALGLILSNTLASFSGVMTCQFHGYSDINMGFGMALIGIGTVAIGEQLRLHLLHQRLLSNHPLRIAFCLGAVFLYFFSLNILVYYGLSPLHIKMAIGLFLIFCLAMTQKKEASYA